ncbi:ferric reductase like transmembrane component [Podospora didyma]|uniref:ferric-chelate reductase (NADPH) n=1 Tax=Podospora didyma TaxID=330526 RepID=A0AAE0N0K4_9PEZI|nr:ferric reductase like transmembrane component [Podospora didyma]
MVPDPGGPSCSPSLVEALTVDPWEEAGKYALAWTYLAVAAVSLAALLRAWHAWRDGARIRSHKRAAYRRRADLEAAACSLVGGRGDEKPGRRRDGLAHSLLALVRRALYRPLPEPVWRKHRLTPCSPVVFCSAVFSLLFVLVLCLARRPLYWQSIRYGSPPLAIRAGMIAVAMTPWIVATSTKSNILTLITGIGPERFNVFHRWLSYLCLFLSLVHTVPFYIQPVWGEGGVAVFDALFPADSDIAIYGSGITCLVPLIWLCAASLPIIRRKAYEIFVMLHVPVGIVYVGTLFWHTKNFLLSWNYLIATIAVFFFCNIPWRMSFMVGDEAAINIMTENTIKVTIPTQMRWKPGQYVYLRMPSISIFENHPFTISSLCSEDFPSEYGEQYRDCVLVFRPYGGFTRKVLETAIEKGPFHTYRALLDGPYGGTRRPLAAFDACVLVAGGTGITPLLPQLQHLAALMRDGKAITRKVVLVWCMKQLEILDSVRESLVRCRAMAPPGAITCKMFVTGAVRRPAAGQDGPRLSRWLADLLDLGLHGGNNKTALANKRRGFVLLGADEKRGDDDDDKPAQLRPPEQAHLRPAQREGSGSGEREQQQQRQQHPRPASQAVFGPPCGLECGFPQPTTKFQRSLMRFAFPIPQGDGRDSSVEFGRPDLPYELRSCVAGVSGVNGPGQHVAIFVCGPKPMQRVVATTVAKLQAKVWGGKWGIAEIYLHDEHHAP